MLVPGGSVGTSIHFICEEGVVRLGMLAGTRLMSALVVATTIAACSGGDDNGTGPTPSIDVALSANTLSLVQGTNGTVNVTLTRAGGFTGPVTLAVEGLPTGVTAVVAPTPIPSGSTTSVITISAAATAAAGTANLTVRASGSGVTDKTSAIALTVNAAPSYTLTVGSATVTVAQGASQTQNITLTRTGGFTGAVALAAEGLPAGVTPSFNPQSVTATSSVLTLNVGGAAAAGTSTITVRGTATGQTDKTATFQLTITAAPAATYTLAVTPTTVPVQQGASATVNIALTRTGGFAGAVALAAEGLPNGVTPAFNPQSVTADASVLTLTAAAGATTGNATITVRGTATGQTDKTATFQLTVNAAPAGGYTMSIAPTSVNVQQGGTNTATITLTRTGGFAGAVALAATGLPNGVTPTFNPQSVTGNTSTLTLTATGTAAVGQATVTVTGTATGVANQTATVTVNVTGTGGGTGNTVFEFCTTADTPVWLAVQDGTGAWARVTPTGTRFQFNIASGRGGVAFVHPTTSAMIASQRTLSKRMSTVIETTLLMRNKAAEVRANRYAARYAASAFVDGFDVSIIYGTQAELNSQGTTQCLAGSGKTVNGTVANVAPTQTADISLGDAFESVSGGTTSFTLTNVPDGALDLVASRSTLNLQTFQTTVDKLIIRRGINAANNSTLPVLDFNAAEAFAPAEANIAVGNLGTDVPLVTTSYFTASGTTGAAIFSGFQTGTGPFKYYGVPTARQIAGDLHFAFVLASPASQTADNARFRGLFFKDPTDRTVTLGAVLPTQTVSVAGTTPYVRLRATGSVTTDYNKVVDVMYTQETTARTVSISATAGYLSNATTYDLTIPDFSGVAGWDNNWGLKTGSATEWTVAGSGFTGIGVSSPAPVEGATIQGAIRFGTITP